MYTNSKDARMFILEQIAESANSLASAVQDDCGDVGKCIEELNYNFRGLEYFDWAVKEAEKAELEKRGSQMRGASLGDGAILC